MTIKILGSGCKNCVNLYENTKEALSQLGTEVEIIKITDFSEIMGYGIMATPGLVVNEKVVSYGKVLKPSDIVRILKKVGK